MNYLAAILLFMSGYSMARDAFWPSLLFWMAGCGLMRHDVLKQKEKRDV